MSKKRFFAALLAVLLLAGNLYAVSPKREWRAVWLTTAFNLDWPLTKGVSSTVQGYQKDQMTVYLDLMQDMKMTTVCFQVRSMCDAMYKSSYEPWSQYLTDSRGTDPGWDPLAWVVEECHKRGLECYAWVNPFRYTTSTDWNTDKDQALEASGMLLTYGSTKVLNPGLAEARKRIVDVCKEIISNYKVDGLLFDDYFYPNGIQLGTKAGDYTLWQQSGSSLSLANWRRDNVNTLVKEVYEMVQATRPDVRFGIGPAGVAGQTNTHGLTACPAGSDWQYSKIYSDPLAWLEAGTIDFISPQIYWHTDDSSSPYEPITKWWSYAANAFGRHHYASVSIDDLTTSSTADHLTEHVNQILLNRQYTENNAPGTNFYSASYLKTNKSALAAKVKSEAFTHPCIVPQITWDSYGNSTSYGAVSGLAYSSGALNWTATTDGNRIIRYSVYAVPSSVSKDAAKAGNGDGFNNAYLLGITYTNSYTVPSDKQSGYWYAVCVLDGWGKEHTEALVNYDNSSSGNTTGGSESGYTVMTDKDSYSNVDAVSVQSVWYRSVDSYYNNITFDSKGGLNRGFCAVGQYVYMAGRDANSSSANIYLRKFSGSTGEILGDLQLTGAGAVSLYPCNDVIKDSGNNVCITNLTTNVTTTPLKVHKVDLSTGALTEVASVTATKVSSGRIDHAAILGNVASGSFTLYAALASDNKVLRWTFENGTQTNEEVCTVASLYPESASNFGTAPRVVPVSDYSFFVDGSNTSWSRYVFGNGTLLDSFAENTAIAPTSNGGNGGTFFSINNKYYMVYSSADNNEGYKFNITSSSASAMGFDSMSLMWTLPKAGLGTVNSSTAQASADWVKVNQNTVRVYLYVPGNGICAYNVKDTSISGIENIAGAADVKIKVSAGTVVLSEEAQSVAVFNVMGAQVAHAENTCEVDAQLAPGLYIVMANVNGKVYKQKIVVK